MKNYIWNILLALDSLIGTFIPGSYPDEEISSRAFREDWRIQSLINLLFNDSKHCEESYWNGVKRRQNYLNGVSEQF